MRNIQLRKFELQFFRFKFLNWCLNVDLNLLLRSITYYIIEIMSRFNEG